MKKYPIYQLDELDLQLLFMVHQQLFQYYKDEASYVLATSSLPQRLQDDPYYIHHYDEQYWCKYVYRKHEQRKSEERAKQKEITAEVFKYLEQGYSIGKIADSFGVETRIIIPIHREYERLKEDDN